MELTDTRILHIDSEKNWRGGQQQAAYLHEKLHAMNIQTLMVCNPDSAMAAYCNKNNLPCMPIPMRGEFTVRAGYRIASICRKLGFNILHLHSAHALATGLWAKMFFKPVHLIAVRRVSNPIRNNVFSHFKYTTPMVDRIVCVSHAIQQILKTGGIPEDKLVTIHSGVDLNKFRSDIDVAQFKKSLGIPQHHILIGTIAAFTHEKDYPSLIQAATKVIEINPDVTFCAVGNGPQEDAMKKMAERHGLGSRFVFAGFRTDVEHFLHTFDIFVLPSLHEGLGTSILDAQALGLPVIACRTGGIPEIVDDGFNGFLVPPHAPASLSDALVKLISDTDLRKEFGQRATQTVKAFSIDRTVEKNIGLYNKLLSNCVDENQNTLIDGQYHRTTSIL